MQLHQLLSGHHGERAGRMLRVGVYVMRLFIAVNLNDEMKDALTEIQVDMHQAGVTGNFTRRENMHMTLAFIGEYSDPELVKEVMERVHLEPFEIGLNGLGTFRNLWWAGLTGSGHLNIAAQRLRRALADAGIPYDRKKFLPHITLVRQPKIAGGRIPEEILENLPEAGMIVDHISLMRSDRGKNGVVYTEL